jgi:hypothetical protein
MLQAISTTDTVPVVRVPWNDPGLIMRVLDAGCYAVICPMINTREEAEAFVGACRYPPEGYRSYGPYRATLYGGQDYTDHANETVVTMAMIETQQAHGFSSRQRHSRFRERVRVSLHWYAESRRECAGVRGVFHGGERDDGRA